MENEVKERVFRYGDQVWGDPGAEFTAAEVQKQLATYYPELAKATTRETALPDGRLQIEFIKNAGLKG